MEKEHKEMAEERVEVIQNGSIAGRLGGSLERKNEEDTVKEALELLNASGSSERKLQQLCLMLKNRETVNSILLSAGTGRSGRTGNGVSTVASGNPIRNAALDAGAPAECVTVAEALERRREKEAQELRDQVEKEQEKLRKQRERTDLHKNILKN